MFTTKKKETWKWIDRSVDRGRRQEAKEKPRFRKIAQFRAWIRPRGSVVFRKNSLRHYRETHRRRSWVSTPFLCSYGRTTPPHRPPPPSTPPAPPPSFSSGIGGVESRERHPRRIDLKSDGLKGVFPLSTMDGLSDKSIYVLANEGWKWCFLIGPFLDHTPFVNKGSKRKPVSLCHNFSQRIFTSTWATFDVETCSKSFPIACTTIFWLSWYPFRSAIDRQK